MRVIIAIIRLFLFGLNCLWVIPAQSLVLVFTTGPTAYHLPRVWHAIACRIFGIRITVHGQPYVEHQTLYMGNHLSYLDIPVIGSVVKASFVSKNDVADWPLFGYLATLQRTAFIQRKRSEAGRQKNALQDRIAHGDSLIIFPEGTSTSGLEVLPFKSSLFALALGEDVQDLYIQPMTLNIVQVAGQVAGEKAVNDLYAWPRDMDMELHHHLWRLARLPGQVHLSLTLHDPIKASDYNDRKVLAQVCQDCVQNGLNNLAVTRNNTA